VTLNRRKDQTAYKRKAARPRRPAREAPERAMVLPAPLAVIGDGVGVAVGATVGAAVPAG